MNYQHLTADEKLRRVRQLLQEARRDASMEGSEFHLLIKSSDDPLPTSESEVTDFIKRRTDLWRQSWVLGPIDEALELLVNDRP